MCTALRVHAGKQTVDACARYAVALKQGLAKNNEFAVDNTFTIAHGCKHQHKHGRGLA